MSQPVQAKILWVHDDYEGPMNGLAEYQGEKLWFKRSSMPDIISSTDVPVPSDDSQSSSTTRVYVLLKLDPKMLDMIEQNHISYCNETGAPLNHGDPIKLRKKKQIVKADFSKYIPEGESFENGIETIQRTLTNVTIYKHTYSPQNIIGDYITTINETDFSNYFVPRRVEL